MTHYKFCSNKDILIRRIYRISAFIIFLLLLSAFLFTKYMLKNEYKSVETYLQQAVMQTSSNIRGRIKSHINDLKDLSLKMSLNSSFSNSDILKFLRVNAEQNKYYKIGFASSDGTALIYSDKMGQLPKENWYNKPCFSSALSGNPCFSETIENSDAGSGFINNYFAPVYNKNNQIIGVLGYSIDSDIFEKILDLNSYNGKGYTHVVDSDGNYIVKSQNDINNFNNFFDTKIKILGHSKDEIKEFLKTKEYGSFWFKGLDGKIYIASFGFIGNNNSYVLIDVPLDVLMLHINTLLGILSVIIFAIFTILVSVLKYTNSIFSKNENIIQQVAFTDDITQNNNLAKFILDSQEILTTYTNDKYSIIAMNITNSDNILNLYDEYKYFDILKDIYSIINKRLPNNCILTRYSDSYHLILYKSQNKDYISRFILEIENDIKEYNKTIVYDLAKNKDLQVKVNILLTFGVFLIKNELSDIKIMYKNALLAEKYASKNANEQNIMFYSDELKNHDSQNESITNEILSALQNNQITMYLQPKINLLSQEVTGAEALVRWIHPERGIIPPLDFVPFCENNGLIYELDKYIWEEVCKFLSARKSAQEKLFPISVNISNKHLYNDAFIDELNQLTQKYQIEPYLLELEFKEKAYFEDKNKFIDIVNNLKSLGFKIIIDNFGINISSFGLLRNFPVDILKIDRTLINDNIEDGRYTFVESILNITKKLDIQTIVEGVEKFEQSEFLKNIGCQNVQGFLYGRPMDINKFKHLILLDN
ncbi:EAL domain-containing protein [bacterium]|nr:EAL domain-containing protein [bacterium]